MEFEIVDAAGVVGEVKQAFVTPDGKLRIVMAESFHEMVSQVTTIDIQEQLKKTEERLDKFMSGWCRWIPREEWNTGGDTNPFNH